MRVAHTDSAVSIALSSDTTLETAVKALSVLPDTATTTLLRSVLAYLAALEARDLAGASAMHGADFVMRFPGAVEFHTLPELLSWGAARYRRVRKRVEGLDAAGSTARGTVYCRGWLDGELPDGSPFQGVRFIDRFAFVGGVLRAQDVWNDLGEWRARASGVALVGEQPC